jgi:phenylacetate-CoA ligase
VFDSLGAVIQYQVVQKSLTVLEVRIVAERPLEKTESDQIVHGLAKQVGPEFEIRLVFVDNIPRLPGGKYMDFVSEIESGTDSQACDLRQPTAAAPPASR